MRTPSSESKCTVDSTASSESVASPVAAPIRTGVRTQLAQRHSVRYTGEDSTQRRSVIPRRSSSFRKTDSPLVRYIWMNEWMIINIYILICTCIYTVYSVQTNVSLPSKSGRLNRSNSRTSLVSSRSSLNSAVSTNTIKKMPPKHATNNVRSTTRSAHITTPTAATTAQKRAVNVIQQPKTVPLKRVPSGSVNNQRPPRPSTGSAPAFMKPTTSSTTKNNNTTGTTVGSAGRLYSSFRTTTTTPFK